MKQRIVSTQAIILRRMDYGETSRIVTLLSKEEGKISVLAKGARTRSNRFGAALEVGTISEIVYYHRSTRELQTLTQASAVERFAAMSATVETITSGCHALDRIEAITHPGESYPELFDEVEAVLRALSSKDARPADVLLSFRAKILRAAGSMPILTQCVSCGRDVDAKCDPVPFDLRRGGILCRECQGVEQERGILTSKGFQRSLSLSRGAVNTWNKFTTESYAAIGSLTTDSRTRNELHSVMRSYEQLHLLHGRTLRSESVIQSMIS